MRHPILLGSAGALFVVGVAAAALMIAPTFAAGYVGRGLVYGIMGDQDRAIADYSEAIKRKPDFAFAYARRSAAYSDKHNYDDAIADYDQVVRLDPTTGSYNARGQLYVTRGGQRVTRDKRDFDRAIADFSEVIRLDPAGTDGYMARGLAYHRKGDYDHAIADFSEVINLNPKLASLYYPLRALAYEAKGDDDRALADYEETMKLAPWFMWMTGAGEKLERLRLRKAGQQH